MIGRLLTFGLVKTIAWPVGLVAWLFFAPTVSAAHKVINLNTEKIKADKKKIEDKESELTGITADVATLNLLATNYAKMAGQTEKVEGNLQAVLNEWRNLLSDVDAAITDIYLATKFKKGAYFSEVLDDINNAIEEWDTACTQAGRLEIEMQVNSAPLEVGMSSSQVQEALAAEQPIAIIKYYKQLMKAA